MLVDFDNAFKTDKSHADEWLMPALAQAIERILSLKPRSEFIQNPPLRWMAEC